MPVHKVVGRLVNCPKCENGCRYCHGHGIVVEKYREPVFRTVKAKAKTKAKKRKPSRADHG